MLASPRRALLTVLGLALIIGAGVYWWKRHGKARSKHTPPSEIEARIRETAELYRVLDAALSLRGVPRPPGTPPLTHARSLKALGHPAAELTIQLTTRYLQARFGKLPMSLDERREFLRQARELAKPPREQKAA